MGVAVGLVFLTSVELKIYCALYAFHKLCLLLEFWFLATILDIWWMLHLLCFHHLVALSNIGKVTKAFLLTPSGSKMADHVAPPPPLAKG